MFRNYIKLDKKRERYKTKHAKNWLLYSLGGALLFLFFWVEIGWGCAQDFCFHFIWNAAKGTQI